MSSQEDRKIFSNNLSYFLNINNMQQKELAERLGVKTATVSAWVTGKSIPSLTTIRSISDIFGILVRDLTENHYDSDPYIHVRILQDQKVMKMMEKFYHLSQADKDAIEQIINSLHKNRDKD